MARIQPQLDPLIPPAPLKATARDGPRYGIADLCGLLETYMPSDQVREVYRAFMYGAEAHDGQKRLTCAPNAAERIPVYGRGWRRFPG